jgi:hypothetical protein
MKNQSDCKEIKTRILKRLVITFLACGTGIAALTFVVGHERLKNLGLAAYTTERRPRMELALLDGAEAQPGKDGIVVILNNKVSIAPLSLAAFEKSKLLLPLQDREAFDRRLFWQFQSNPLAYLVAADLERGQLQQFVTGGVFDTDRYFLELFVPEFIRLCSVANVSPSEAIMSLEHGLLTLRAPFVREPDKGLAVFNEQEITFTLKQAAIQKVLRSSNATNSHAQWLVLKLIEQERVKSGYVNASAVELIARAPAITFGSEEGTIAHAHAISLLGHRGGYSNAVIEASKSFLTAEAEKDSVRRSISASTVKMAAQDGDSIRAFLRGMTQSEWESIGLGSSFSPETAGDIHGATFLGVATSQLQKRGQTLEKAVPQASAEVKRLLLSESLSNSQIARAFLKDRLWSKEFYALLAKKYPELAPQVSALTQDATHYRALASKADELELVLYNQLITEGEDIGSMAFLRQTVGFYAHLARLVDDQFSPRDSSSPEYRKFRRVVASFMREAPDLTHVGGANSPIRLFGAELTASPDLTASEASFAPVLKAIGNLYTELQLNESLESKWDYKTLYAVLAYGSFSQAEIGQDQLPELIRGAAAKAQTAQTQALAVIGGDGLRNAGVQYGIQHFEGRLVPYGSLPNLVEVSESMHKAQKASSSEQLRWADLGFH